MDTTDPTIRNSAPEIRRGEIYRDIYAKRTDDRPVQSSADLKRGLICGEQLCFADEHSFRGALEQGIFQLKIPDWIDPAPGDRFAAEFYRGAATGGYGAYRELSPDNFGDSLLGYHQRITQLEQFLLERRFWSDTYPDVVTTLGEQFTRLSGLILRSVLTQVGIPISLWAQATGGASEGSGSYHLTFNHYRPTLESVGLSSHKDDGFVTILRTTMPGLEVNHAENWEAVPVDPSFFVINFGLSMEILTLGCETPVSAIMHRVTHQDTDRSSFGHFTSSRAVPGEDEGIYRYLPDPGLVRVCGSRELIEENDYEIYRGTRATEE
jgi:hypothetical protein